MQSYKKNRNFANFLKRRMIISDLHTALLSYLKESPIGQVFVLTDANVASHIPAILCDYPTLIIAAGEENKSLESAEKVWNFLLTHGATRQALLINIGGGMVTDLGGFVAATYMRGIRRINIPTSLLAMVDASTGGKTGINLGGVKNLVGTFTTPLATLIYPPLLSTLPARELLSGYAEMLKHGLIADAQHWHDLLRCEIHTDCWKELGALVEDSIRIKENIVSSDFNEQNLRKALNFGHTIGHAIEEAYAAQSRPIAHGYCVLWGMVAELYLSVIKQGLPREILTQMSHLMLTYYGRPECNCKEQEQLIEWMRKDKKNTANAEGEKEIIFTLLRQIGEPVINQTATTEEI